MENTNKTKSFFKAHRYTTSFISGIIFATPFMCEWLFPLTFIGLISFFYALEPTHFPISANLKKKPLYDFLCFFFFIFGCCITVYTLFFKLYPFEGYDFSPAQGIGIVIFAWIASSLIHGAFGGIILQFSKHFKSNLYLYPLMCGCLWVIFEYSLSLGFLAFPWINVSVSLVRFLPYIQTASLFGNGIISLITIIFCCSIAIFLHDKSKVRLIKASCILFAINLLTGTVLLLIPESKEKDISVCIIQGNVTMGEKWQSGVFDQILSDHEKLIRSSLEGGEYDLVVMAETVFPALYTKHGKINQVMSKIASDYDVTIIFGAITSAPNNKKNNCIIAVYPDGSTSEEYVKQKLVPFGEKMPSFDIIGRIVPALTQLDIGTSYVEGTEGKIIETHEGIKTGPLVCYDSVFSSLARENVLKGAEIMVVSTNDSWYKDGAAVRQHQSQSVIRAIETGRYVFRSANTGISCIITSKGIITQETEILKEEYICGKGYASQRKTLFVLLGNTSLYFSFICVFSLFALKSLKKTKK